MVISCQSLDKHSWNVEMGHFQSGLRRRERLLGISEEDYLVVYGGLPDQRLQLLNPGPTDYSTTVTIAYRGLLWLSTSN